MSLQDFASYFVVCKSWKELIKRAVLRDDELRARMVYEAVRYNDVEAVRILFGECGVDAKEIFRLDVEGLNVSVWTAISAACVYDHVETVRLLVEVYGALEDRCKYDIECLMEIAEDPSVLIILEIYRQKAPRY